MPSVCLPAGHWPRCLVVVFVVASIAQSYYSQNERDHIKNDFTVPAPAHNHGKRHFGGNAQADHLATRGGYLMAADGGDTGPGGGQQKPHGKAMYGNRNVDNVRELVGS